MSGINWNRVILGGLIAALICFLTDGFFHESVVSADWKAVYAHLGAREPQHSPAGMAYFARKRLQKVLAHAYRVHAAGGVMATEPAISSYRSAGRQLVKAAGRLSRFFVRRRIRLLAIIAAEFEIG